MSYYKVQENNITDKYTAYDIFSNDITIGLIVENKQNWQSSDYMGSHLIRLRKMIYVKIINDLLI